MKKYILTTLLVATLLVGQNKDSIQTKTITEIIITANKKATNKREIPLAVNKITSQLITETKATSMVDLINKSVGVNMVNLGNEQHSLGIRLPNTTNSYYLFLEDGLPIRPLGIYNHNSLLEFNQFNIENIEIIKGPVSSLYGSEAIGGAINVFTKKAEKTSLIVSSQINSYGYKNYFSTLTIKEGKLGFVLSGMSSKQNDSWMTYSDYKKDNFNFRIDYELTKKLNWITALYYGDYYSDMFGSVNETKFHERDYTSTTDFTYRKSKALRIRTTLDQQWNSNSHSTITLFTRDNLMGQNPNYAIRWTTGQTTARGEVNENSFKSYGVIAQHIQDIKLINTQVIVGASLDRSPNTYYANQIDLKANLNPGGQTVNYFEIASYRPDIILANYEAVIKNTAGFAQTKTKVFNNTYFTLGTRYDQMDLAYTNILGKAMGEKKYNQFTFKGGINHNLNKNIGFYGNISQGFTPPSVTSVFRLKPNTGGNTGNPAEFYYNLEPATFINYEIGGFTNLLKNKLFIEYACYLMKGKNELLNIRQADNSFDYQSAGKTKHLGVEIGINYKPSNQIQLRAGGSYGYHQFIDFVLSTKPTDALKDLNGKEMPSAPRFISNNEINYYPNWLKGSRISIEHQWISSYYQDQINTVKYSGYTNFNARISYKIKFAEIYGQVFNAFDKLYAYNVTRANANNAQPTFTPAAPRTFIGGITFNIDFK